MSIDHNQYPRFKEWLLSLNCFSNITEHCKQCEPIFLFLGVFFFSLFLPCSLIANGVPSEGFVQNDMYTLNFPLIKKKMDSGLSLEEATNEYLGQWVHIRGFLRQNAHDFILAQSPKISSCCHHEPRKEDVIKVIFIQKPTSIDTQEIISLEGVLQIKGSSEDEHHQYLVLTQACTLEIQSPVSAFWQWLKSFF